MNTIDAKLLARMFLAGAKNLEVKKEWNQHDSDDHVSGKRSQ